MPLSRFSRGISSDLKDLFLPAHTRQTPSSSSHKELTTNTSAPDLHLEQGTNYFQYQLPTFPTFPTGSTSSSTSPLEALHLALPHQKHQMRSGNNITLDHKQLALFPHNTIHSPSHSSLEFHTVIRSGCMGMGLLTRISTCLEHGIDQGGNASIIWRQRSLKVFFCHLKLNVLKYVSLDSVTIRAINQVFLSVTL